MNEREWGRGITRGRGRWRGRGSRTADVGGSQEGTHDVSLRPEDIQNGYYKTWMHIQKTEQSIFTTHKYIVTF